jgi:hypothetical protein
MSVLPDIKDGTDILEHDPEKWKPVFGQEIMLDQKNVAACLDHPRRHSFAVQPGSATLLLFSTLEGLPMTLSSRLIAIVAASLLLGGTAFAQTTAPATPAPASKMAPAAKTKKVEKPRTAASLECSKEADAKGLHGKERKKFRSECKAKAAKPN